MVTVLQFQCDDPERTFLTPEELADSLDVKLSRLIGWRKNGGGPEFVKFGKTVKYKVSAVDQWIEEHTHQRIGDHPARASRRQR